MPGLVGYVSKKYAGTELIDAMAKPMLHRPDYAVRKTVEGNFAACAIVDESKNAAVKEGDTIRKV